MSVRTVAKLRLPALLVLIASASLTQACPPKGFTKERLQELKASQFKALAPAQREPFALALLECLGAPDPVLRDELAFESLSALLRSQQLSSGTATTILERLQPQLASTFADPQGFKQPFAALTLAEVARMDRIERFLNDAQWSGLLRAATKYVSDVRDYRGFDQTEGWRHGVAHGADLLLQIALNPRASKADLDAVLAAIPTQIAPSEHFYIYGEPLRLARPVLFVAQRGLHSEQEWRVWLQDIAKPTPLNAWSDAFKTQLGLAKRHNTVQFLTSLYLLIQENGEPAARERVLGPLKAALAGVP